MDEIDRDAAMELLSKDMADAADPIDDDIGREATTALELLRNGMPSAVELIDEVTRDAVVAYPQLRWLHAHSSEIWYYQPPQRNRDHIVVIGVRLVLLGPGWADGIRIRSLRDADGTRCSPNGDLTVLIRGSLDKVIDGLTRLEPPSDHDTPIGRGLWAS